jgi:hypothetical protein
MIVTCEICNKKIERKPSEILKHTFCSKQCFSIYRRNVEVRNVKRKLNKYKICDGYIIIYTNTNKEILIDKEDFKKVSKYTWHLGAKGYAVTSEMKKCKCTLILMHRLIMDAPKEMIVDHINHNRLDNRKSNLRICTIQQNIMNSKCHKDSKSKVRGVDYHNRDKLWRARITINGKRISLGWFKSKDDAVKARLAAEITYYKEFANQPKNDGR